MFDYTMLSDYNKKKLNIHNMMMIRSIALQFDILNERANGIVCVNNNINQECQALLT